MSNYLSKVKVGSITYDLKDAEARADLEALLGEHAVEALGAAAWLGVDNAVTTGGTGVVTGGKIKEYVDSQIGTINKFDVVVDSAGTKAGPSVTASATTMYKLYLVPDDKASAGSYIEWITIRSGSSPSYTYAWEKIGSTQADLSGYVKSDTKIAGIAIGDGIAKNDLQTALELGDLAYADTATGSTTLETIDSITMNDVTVAGNATITYTSTAAQMTTGSYTPSGSITGDAIKDGTIDVTLKDSTTKGSISDLTYDAYTPAGTVAATATDGSFSALKSATFAADNDGVQIEGTVSAPAINITAGSEKTFVTGLTGGSVASFTEGEFTPAAIQDGFYTAGSDASLSAGAQANLTAQSKDTFAKKVLKPQIVAGDAECLEFVYVDTAEEGVFGQAVTDRGTFTPNTLQELTGGKATVINTAKFSGGSKAADSFTANVLQGTETAKVHDTPSAALANAPVFTGSKYKVSTTADTALKNVEFTGTSADIKLASAKYVKQEVDTAEFTGTAATLGFSGATINNFVTGANYQKADATAAFSETVTPTTKTLTKTAKTIEITVEADE